MAAKMQGQRCTDFHCNIFKLASMIITKLNRVVPEPPLFTSIFARFTQFTQLRKRRHRSSDCIPTVCEHLEGLVWQPLERDGAVEPVQRALNGGPLVGGRRLVAQVAKHEAQDEAWPSSLRRQPPSRAADPGGAAGPGDGLRGRRLNVECNALDALTHMFLCRNRIYDIILDMWMQDLLLGIEMLTIKDALKSELESRSRMEKKLKATMILNDRAFAVSLRTAALEGA